LIGYLATRQKEAGRKSLRRFGFWVATCLLGLAALFGAQFLTMPFPLWILGFLWLVGIAAIYVFALRHLRTKGLI
jgi:membrane-associated PAP2 superfamily phosphatase